MPSSPEIAPLNHPGIVDLRGLNLFSDSPETPSRAEKKRSAAEFPVKLEPVEDTEGKAGSEVTLTLRFSPEEVERLRAYGRALKEGILPASGEQADDFVNQVALSVLDGECVTLTPDHRGSDFNAINAYFCDMLSPEIDAIESAAKLLPALDPNCKASICIPVAAHEEGRFIYRALEAFSRQTADASEFEIVLYLNHPTRRKDGTSVQPDATLSEVERFKSNYPHLRVHAFYADLPPEQAKIGPIRKFLTDVVLMRHFQRGEDLPELILIRADADTHGVKREYIENYIRLFAKHSNVDAFKGKLDWDWPGYLKDPVLLFGTRFFLALDAYLDATTEEIGGGGANFAIRAARYADLGGYDPQRDMAEDVQLGVALKELRLGAERHVAIQSAGARSRLWTDNRRGAAALQKGHAPVCQWHNGETDFGAENSEIRAVPLPEVGKSFDELLHAPEFHSRVATVIQQTVDFYTIPSDPKRAEFVEHVLPKFGIEATLAENGKITLGNVEGLMRWLAHFHAHAPAYWREQLGFGAIES